MNKVRTGYLPLHNKILDWEWYKDVNTFKLFVHLLLTVNFEDKFWKGIEVKAGQKITSLKHLSDETGLTVQQTRTSLSKLKTTGEVTTKATNKYTLVTVVNWASYRIESGKATSKPTRNTTNEQQTTNKQLTTTEEYKNIRIKESNKNICAKYAHEIDILWGLYPNKKGKAQAIKKLPKLIEQHGFEKIKECIERYAKEVQGKDVQYIKHGSTFFNSGYMDYLEQVKVVDNSSLYELCSWVDAETGQVHRGTLQKKREWIEAGGVLGI